MVDVHLNVYGVGSWSNRMSERSDKCHAVNICDSNQIERGDEKGGQLQSTKELAMRPSRTLRSRVYAPHQIAVGFPSRLLGSKEQRLVDKGGGLTTLQPLNRSDEYDTETVRSASQDPH